jgi:hypothetical protein
VKHASVFTPRLARFALSLALVAGLGMTVLAQHASAYFESRIYNAGAGLCLSSLGTHTDGAPAEDESCNGSANQTWVAAPASAGGEILQNQGDGWCLNNYQGIFGNGNPQTMWPCNNSGGPSNYKQSYVIFGSHAVGGDYSIETVTSSDNVSGYCLSSYGYTSPGSEIYEFGCNTSANQAWEGGTLTPP